MPATPRLNHRGAVASPDSIPAATAADSTVLACPAVNRPGQQARHRQTWSTPLEADAEHTINPGGPGLHKRSQRHDGLQIQPPVHFTAVPDHRNGDHTGVVVHVVDDPVVTYPYSQPWAVAF